MNVWKIGIKNLRSKPLYTVLSVFMLSLSIALLLGILQLKTSFEYQLDNNLGDIDLVVGAKGSPLQLVLSSILHLDNPTGNIDYGEAQKLGKNRLIDKAVPISYGDNHQGYKIVGTTDEFASFYNAQIDQGRAVERSMEVVLGASVAEKLQLQLGDTFLSSHGLVSNDIDVHDEELTVVGIYQPTQKVIDRLIITNLETIWDVHDHEGHEDGHDSMDKDHEEGEEDHDHDHEDGDGHNHDHEDGDGHDQEDHEDDEDKQITSLLISFRSPTALLTMPRQINEDSNMQAALPKYELNKLYEYTGVGLTTVSWIAYIILLISGMTIFMSLFKMIKERAFDLALLRTYGASNFQLIKMVSYEGLIILILAFGLGWGMAHLGLSLLLGYMDSGPQQLLLKPLPLEQALQIVGLVLAMVILSIVLAIMPIIKMNISTILSHEK